ncbi:hypothetical protein GCM10027597_47180 [Saccharopolyspora tripterygii]
MPSTPGPDPLHRWRLAGWCACFIPICAGLFLAGFARPTAFFPAAALWSAALACVLRMESLDHRSRAAAEVDPRQQLAKAGWLLLAIILIALSALIVHASFG